MKNHFRAILVGSICVLALAACGGGGGGGGGGAGAQKQTTKLYLFGNLSTNYYVDSVTTRLSVPNFVDYSTSASVVNGVYSVKSGVFLASGPIQASSVAGTYNVSSHVLTLTLTNGNHANMTAGNGTEVAKLVTSAGTTLPNADTAPEVGQFKLTPTFEERTLNGCSVNFAP